MYRRAGTAVDVRAGGALMGARTVAARRRTGTCRTHRREDQRGVTLIELLIGMAISGIIVTAAAGLFIQTSQTSATTRARLAGSASALQTNARFVDDIRSATPIGPALAVARGQQGCGGDSASLLRVLVQSGDDVEVRSYSLAAGGGVLQRRVCSGADLTAALAASGEVSEVASELAGGAGAPTVTCRANPGASPAPLTPAGDEQCRIVTLDVKTTSGYAFQLKGHRDSNQTPVVSNTNSKRCTLVSSADTWISSYDPNTNYGREWHMSAFRRKSGSSGYVTSFLMVDLLGPCTGPGEPAFLPGGKRILSADLQLWLIRNGSPDCCGYESEHGLRVLGDPWDEATVTWNSRPNVRSGSNTQIFQTGRPFTVQKPFTFTVLDEVNRWYKGPSAGGWPNYGWQLDRGDTPAADDTGGDNGFWWGARESSDVRHWPKLTVTWE